MFFPVLKCLNGLYTGDDALLTGALKLSLVCAANWPMLGVACVLPITIGGVQVGEVLLVLGSGLEDVGLSSTNVTDSVDSTLDGL